MAVELISILDIPIPTSPYRIMAEAEHDIPLLPLIEASIKRLLSDPADPALLFDLSLALQFYRRNAVAMLYQRRALALSRLVYDPPAGEARLKILFLAAPGDLTINMPIELVLHGRPIALTKLYLVPGEPLPSRVPDHDVLLVGISEYDETAPLLAALETYLADWPRPVVNRPEAISALSREKIAARLKDIPGLIVPTTARLGASELAALAEVGLPAGLDFPLIIRPVGSHSGRGMARLGNASDLVAYLKESGRLSLFLASFVDYRSADGLYRKYRIALIGGRPYLCHLAISPDWVVHYAKSGMEKDGAKRDEEKRAMEGFDGDFAKRHGPCLAAMAERIGLDIVVIDCAETVEGKLVFFEADNAGAMHDLDPPDLFPYKPVQMRKVFDALIGLLAARAGKSISAVLTGNSL